MHRQWKRVTSGEALKYQKVRQPVLNLPISKFKRPADLAFALGYKQRILISQMSVPEAKNTTSMTPCAERSFYGRSYPRTNHVLGKDGEKQISETAGPLSAIAPLLGIRDFP